MKVDKTFGKGWSTNETTELDDLVFYIYLNGCKHPDYPIVDQDTIIELKNHPELKVDYDNANMHLRKDKIEKLKNANRQK